MITIVMSATISAHPHRVWRALTEPSELAAWDERILDPIDIDSSYPFSGQHVRWRYRLGGVQVVMHDRPKEIVPYKRLQSSLQMGSLRYEQTYTLASHDVVDRRDAPPKTHLGMKLVASNSVPLIGGVIDRFEVRRMTVAHIDTTLKSIQAWCERTD